MDRKSTINWIIENLQYCSKSDLMQIDDILIQELPLLAKWFNKQLVRYLPRERHILNIRNTIGTFKDSILVEVLEVMRS
jgi:hypothetical protein